MSEEPCDESTPYQFDVGRVLTPERRAVLDDMRVRALSDLIRSLWLRATVRYRMVFKCMHLWFTPTDHNTSLMHVCLRRRWHGGFHRDRDGATP